MLKNCLECKKEFDTHRKDKVYCSLKCMKKANLTPDQIMQKIISLSHLVIAPKITVKVCRDEKDNKFLECAECAKTDYFVSGDDDLLSLKEYNGIPIVRTWKILQLLE